MRLLLDTHLFLWYVSGDIRFPKTTRSKISHASEVYISSASIWEVSIKIKLKKLDAEVDQLVQAIAKSDFLELPILAKHAAAVFRLPDVHRDPFDRLLIAQAISESLIFLTADTVLKNYSDLVELIC
jgi:PIN domain nuclease of toxin-antitoxin system